MRSFVCPGTSRWPTGPVVGPSPTITELIASEGFCGMPAYEVGVYSASPLPEMTPLEIDARLNDIATAIWGIQHKPIFGWGISRYTALNSEHHQSWGNIDWNLNNGFVSHNTHMANAAELGLAHPDARFELDFTTPLELLVALILAAQFRSYWQPLLILVTVPLAFTGVALGLIISRDPLSLYTMYGVIALTGIAVNSAIGLIEAANDRVQSGMGGLHAAVDAARRRVVPIIITSVTTVGGLFSLAFGLGGKSMLWGPVASAIVWGLGFATVLTLFVIPLLYWLFMRPRTASRRGLLQRFSFGRSS